ncbi:DUF1330 domain-containing protein [Hahella aquimaris]|uniref:DUF1330 domain-containing protein n=1 Tax=Hahella sp. HNIBRBA332 TaxID=3015983 RepID=UPI00273CCA5B|nr:DUF1330 domain-containing protein [Hahella sp. HNIBRBA332]WLQ12928.1 DUF1330 domain-containing protein [Hahella sp. HNIBRBA332]
MASINPDWEELAGLLTRMPPDQPVVMLNLLKFHDIAAYADASVRCSGREAYATYSQTALQTVREVGGELLWMGRAQASVIAPAGEKWDEVLLVRYPSIQAFHRMLSMPDYQACVIHRTAALADSRLIATTEHTPL